MITALIAASGFFVGYIVSFCTRRKISGYTGWIAWIFSILITHVLLALVTNAVVIVTLVTVVASLGSTCRLGRWTMPIDVLSVTAVFVYFMSTHCSSPAMMPVRLGLCTWRGR